jgi:hypothetical protein
MDALQAPHSNTSRLSVELFDTATAQQSDDNDNKGGGDGVRRRQLVAASKEASSCGISRQRSTRSSRGSKSRRRRRDPRRFNRPFPDFRCTSVVDATPPTEQSSRETSDGDSNQPMHLPSVVAVDEATYQTNTETTRRRAVAGNDTKSTSGGLFPHVRLVDINGPMQRQRRQRSVAGGEGGNWRCPVVVMCRNLGGWGIVSHERMRGARKVYVCGDRFKIWNHTILQSHSIR